MITRIIKKRDYFLPQYLGKFLWFNVWFDFPDGDDGDDYDPVVFSTVFKTLEEAEKFLEKYDYQN
jgi:hypothetical protein